MFSLGFMIIFYPYMAALLYSEGSLSVSKALNLLWMSMVGGIIVGIICWLFGTRPFFKRIERKRKETSYQNDDK